MFLGPGCYFQCTGLVWCGLYCSMHTEIVFSSSHALQYKTDGVLVETEEKNCSLCCVLSLSLTHTITNKRVILSALTFCVCLSVCPCKGVEWKCIHHNHKELNSVIYRTQSPNIPNPETRQKHDLNSY